MSNFTTDTIKAVQEKNFSGFADDIKGELRSRLAQHETIRAYAQEVQTYQDYRQAFSDINSGVSL